MNYKISHKMQVFNMKILPVNLAVIPWSVRENKSKKMDSSELHLHNPLYPNISIYILCTDFY